MERQVQKSDPKFRIDPNEGGILARATVRAADRLNVKAVTLADILGLSEPTISRMRKGTYKLKRENKEFELAALFIRMYRSLDAIVGGDDTVAQQWIKNPNTALGAAPINLIKSIQGLLDVIHYLDSRRAPI